MPRLSRVYQKIFGQNASIGQIGKFGSLSAGTPETTSDPSQAQSLSNWLGGWYSAVVASNAPAIEDMNAVHFVMAYQLAYLMENGIPQYEATTEYFAGSVVQYSNQYYKCLVDGTVGVTPAVGATWQYITDATYSLASNSGHNVATGTTIQTQLDAIDSYIYNSVIPVGTILPFSGSSAPSGFLFTDGSAVNRTGTYANLFSTIGTTYGAGNLTTTFNIPDTRGIFLRGVGTNPSNGSNVTTLGARQLDAFKSHTHTMNMWNGNSSAAQNPFGTQSAVYQGTYTSNATGDTETRPANLGVNHIIKY